MFFVQGVEERHYKATKWVSTQVNGMNHEEARSQGFGRLLKYITGTNENSKYNRIINISQFRVAIVQLKNF